MTLDEIKLKLESYDEITTKILKGDKELFDALLPLKKIGQSFVTLALSIRGGHYENNFMVCCVCQKQFPIKNARKLGNSGFRIPIVCGHSCELTRRHLADPEYYYRIKTKAYNTKTSTIIDGMNMHTIGSYRAAEARKILYQNNEIGKKLSETFRIKREARKKNLQTRISDIFVKYGAERSIKRFFISKRIVKSYNLFHKFVHDVYSYLEREIPSDDKITEIYMGGVAIDSSYMNCIVCDTKFVRYIDGPLSPKTNSKYCSVDCKRLNMYGTEDNPSEYLKSLHVQRAKMWEDRDGSAWSKAMLQTMGDDGKRKRADAALKTKLERGIIAKRRDNISTEYRDYRNLCTSITKTQDITILENHDSRGKHTYHLDHIFPISRGYVFNIPPELIGNIENLRMMPANENRIKSNTLIFIPPHIEAYLETFQPETLREILNEIESYNEI